MSTRTFDIGDRNEHGLYPFTRFTTVHEDGCPRIQMLHLADLTDEELASIEEQGHQRRAERD